MLNWENDIEKDIGSYVLKVSVLLRKKQQQWNWSKSADIEAKFMVLNIWEVFCT